MVHIGSMKNLQLLLRLFTCSFTTWNWCGHPKITVKMSSNLVYQDFPILFQGTLKSMHEKFQYKCHMQVFILLRVLSISPGLSWLYCITEWIDSKKKNLNLHILSKIHYLWTTEKRGQMTGKKLLSHLNPHKCVCLPYLTSMELLVSLCHPSPASSCQSFLTLWVVKGHGTRATTLCHFHGWLIGLGELAGLKLIPPPCVTVASPPMWSFIYSHWYL